GTVCAVAFSGNTSGSQWLGSPTIRGMPDGFFPASRAPAYIATDLLRTGGKPRRINPRRINPIASKQTPVQRAARKQHLLNCRVHGPLRDNIARRELELKLGAAAHEFFDECRTDALRAADNERQQIFGDFQPARIQLRQLTAALVIRQRKLDRLIDSAGS